MNENVVSLYSNEGVKGGRGLSHESREINEVFHDSRKFFEGFHVSRKISAGWSDYRAVDTICNNGRSLPNPVVPGQHLIGVQGAKAREPQKFGIFGVPNKGQKLLSLNLF